MAKLELTERVIKADCFSDFTKDEMMALLRVVGKKYFKHALLGRPSRVHSFDDTGAQFADPDPQVNGTRFLHIQYTFSQRIVALLFMVHRQLGIDLIHDRIRVLQLSWSGAIDGAPTRAIYSPKHVKFASNETLKSGSALFDEGPLFDVPPELEIKVGADLSEARGLHGEFGLMAQLTSQITVAPRTSSRGST